MSELLNQALGKIGISSVQDPLFQGLPATRDDPLWNSVRLENTLSFLELGRLKNARCIDNPAVQDGGNSVSEAATPPNIISFSLGQNRASNFTSEHHYAFKGLGVNFPMMLFDPNVRGKFISDSLIPLKDPDPQTINHVQRISRQLFRICLMKVDGSIIHETGDGITTQKHHLDFLKSILGHISGPYLLTTTEKSSITLKSIGCPVGCVSEASQPDGYICSPSLALAVGDVEVTDTSYAPINCLRQSFAYATNMAFQLVSKGIPAEDIMIPLLGSNGQLCQFGCLKLLDPLFPYFLCTSRVLDLGSEGDRDIVAGYLVAMERFLTESSKYYESFTADLTTVTHGIDRDKYYFKHLSKFFSLYENDIEGGLRHYFNVMKTVFDCKKLRSSVGFPICVFMETQTIKKTEYDISLCSLVFDNYSDYRIGFPSSSEQRKKYYNELADLVSALHASGVVHLDLYPSNIMWKIDENGDNKIKLIDFDQAIFVWELLTTETQIRLERDDAYRERLACTYCKRHSIEVGNKEKKNLAYDLSLLEVIKDSLNDPSLQINDKAKLDSAFFKICCSHLDRANEESTGVDLESLSIPL